MRLDYTIVRGDTRIIDLDLLDRFGQVFDFSGASVIMRVANLFEKDLSDGIDLSSGDLTVTIDPADTEGCPDQRTAYAYDIAVTEADGTVSTAQRGLFIVLPDVAA